MSVSGKLNTEATGITMSKCCSIKGHQFVFGCPKISINRRQKRLDTILCPEPATYLDTTFSYYAKPLVIFPIKWRKT